MPSSPLQLAKQKLGQLFITGFNGLELSENTSRFLQDANIGGVILFAPNYESPGQLAELTNQIQDLRKGSTEALPFWISVDHEGGRVQRFKKGFTRIPDATTLALSNSPKLIFEIAQMIARELAAAGVNLNFSPVADIQTNPKNPVIGNRAFSTTEETVTKMVTAMVRGQLTEGVQPCIKHFPGHGDTSVDSHFALPKVDTDLETLMRREFIPFTRASRSHCRFIMTAHVICTQIDADYPATLSKKILSDILRGELRYTGLIISDDLEMKAIADHFGAEDAPRLALEAGCDLLIYRSEAATQAAYSALTRALDSKKLQPDKVLAAVKRIEALKKEVLLPYHPARVAEVSEKIGTPENHSLIEKVSTLQK